MRGGKVSRMRLIDADAFKTVLSELEMQHDKRRSFDDYSYGAASAYEHAGDLLDEAPTVERPHGKWKVDNKIYCSECGKSICDFIPNPNDAVGIILSNNFCFNCGADMREECENNDGTDA